MAYIDRSNPTSYISYKAHFRWVMGRPVSWCSGGSGGIDEKRFHVFSPKISRERERERERGDRNSRRRSFIINERAAVSRERPLRGSYYYD
jgi:hypothetical protein